MASVLTDSERLFEEWCTSNHVPCERVSTTDTRTPDYVVEIGSVRVVVEVKEMGRNEEEQASDRALYETGIGHVLSVTPGERVRKKIADASKQIKARSRGLSPGLLVLFDRGLSINHLDSYQIRVAMYGLEQVYIAVPTDTSISPYSTGRGFGPKRKMTEVHNTSISALAVLHARAADNVTLTVYHNVYAKLPIPPTAFRGLNVEQFALLAAQPGNVPQWGLV